MSIPFVSVVLFCFVIAMIEVQFLMSVVCSVIMSVFLCIRQSVKWVSNDRLEVYAII